jgi:PDZ domain
MDNREVRSFDDLANRIERLPPGTAVSLRVRRVNEQIGVVATLVDRPGVSGSMRRVALPPWPDPVETRAPGGARWDLDQLRRASLGSFDIASVVLGVQTQPVTESLAQRLSIPTPDGALISGVVKDSPAERAGLRSSDVIVSLNDVAVQSPRQLHEQIRKLAGNSNVRLQFVRDGKREEVSVALTQNATGAGTDESLRWFVGAIQAAEPFRSRIELLEQRIKTLEALLLELQKRLDEEATAAPASKK